MTRLQDGVNCCHGTAETVPKFAGSCLYIEQRMDREDAIARVAVTWECNQPSVDRAHSWSDWECSTRGNRGVIAPHLLGEPHLCHIIRYALSAGVAGSRT